MEFFVHSFWRKYLKLYCLFQWSSKVMKFCLLQHILKVLVFLSFNLFGPITKTSSKFKLGISIVSNTFEQNLNVGYDLISFQQPALWVLSLVSIWLLTIAGSLKILPAIVSDYMETLFSNRPIVSNRQRLYGNTFQRSGDRRRSWAILHFRDFSDSSDLAIMSDSMETRL